MMSIEHPSLPHTIQWCIDLHHTELYVLVVEKRLTSQDWIEHGFKVLGTEGFRGLKAGRMVKGLNVSRGSFYWHFKSLKTFHQALLAAWRKEITEEVIADLRAIPEGKDQLRELIASVVAAPQELEAAMRSWARVDPEVAIAVAQVDQLRADYLTEVIAMCGVDRAIARARASLLTWAHIGRTFAPELVETVGPKEIDDFAQLLVSPH